MPGYYPEASASFPKNPWICSGHFPKKSWMFHGTLDIYPKRPGDVPEISRECPGNIMEIARKCPGTFPEVFRTCPGNVPDISGEFLEMSRKSIEVPVFCYQGRTKTSKTSKNNIALATYIERTTIKATTIDKTNFRFLCMSYILLCLLLLANLFVQKKSGRGSQIPR